MTASTGRRARPVGRASLGWLGCRVRYGQSPDLAQTVERRFLLCSAHSYATRRDQAIVIDKRFPIAGTSSRTVITRPGPTPGRSSGAVGGGALVRCCRRRGARQKLRAVGRSRWLRTVVDNYPSIGAIGYILPGGRALRPRQQSKVLCVGGRGWTKSGHRTSSGPMRWRPSRGCRPWLPVSAALDRATTVTTAGSNRSPRPAPPVSHGGVSPPVSHDSVSPSPLPATAVSGSRRWSRSRRGASPCPQGPGWTVRCGLT